MKTNPNELIVDQQVLTSERGRVKKVGPSTYNIVNSNVPLKLIGKFLITPQGNQISATEFMKIMDGKATERTMEKYNEEYNKVVKDLGLEEIQYIP